MEHKICVIGAGDWGKNHIRTLFELGSLGGIVDSDSKTLNNFKSQYPSISLFNTLTDALKANKSYGFVVATPAETHYNIAKIRL